jgi:hypothetical protein
MPPMPSFALSQAAGIPKGKKTEKHVPERPALVTVTIFMIVRSFLGGTR